MSEQSEVLTWSERVNAAYDAWTRHWSFIPGRFRMDRALKEAGVRDLIVERDHLRSVAVSAAYHLRNLPATTEKADIEMAEALEAAARGGRINA